MLNQENREVAINLSGVKKRYKLGQIGGGSLQADLQSWWAKIRGKEDPNTKIGEDRRLYGQTFMALNGIDLTIYKGEALGIIGGNGAGKSTLLKILSRVTAPTEGEIDIYGRIASMLEVGTGFSPEMTGRENIYMNGTILGMTKEEIDAKMEQIIDFSEVREFIDTPVKRYSSGMYVKLAFSVAAHLDSEIMIMDEVLAVGDMAFQKKCLTKMRDAANKEGKTVLYVSHNMNTIRQLCDRCIVLDKGKIVFSGDVNEAIEIYNGISENSQGVVDASQIVRDDQFKEGKAKILKIYTPNAPKGIINVGDKLDLFIDVQCDCDFKDVNFRAILKTTESIPITMYPTENGVDLNKDKIETVKFTLDTSNVAPGKYSLSFVVYQLNEIGNDFFLDGLKEVFFFDIIATKDFNRNMDWRSRYWGNVFFAPSKLEKEELIDG